MATTRPRRFDHSEFTRSALVDSAVELFSQLGYAATSLDEIAKRARVTKGALYHHFAGKQALFEAAFDAVETRVLTRLRSVLDGPAPPWERAQEGLRAYLDSCLDPAYQRIAVHEAPVVMGWERWRAAEDQFSLGIISTSVRELIDAGEVDDVPVEVTARMLFGALSTAATTIASAAEPERVSGEVETVLMRLLHRIRRTEGSSAASSAETDTTG